LMKLPLKSFFLKSQNWQLFFHHDISQIFTSCWQIKESDT